MLKLIYPCPLTADNTNADPETRAFWVTLAKDASVPIRCIYFSTPAKICRHNNAVRAANSNIVCHLHCFHSLSVLSALVQPVSALLLSQIPITTERKEKRRGESICLNLTNSFGAKETINPESRPLLPDIAFIDFARRFHEPSLAEGFQDITRVDFRFHGTPATAKIWGQYWV